MITSKQRAFIRGRATLIQSTFQIGKDGVTDNMAKSISDALEANEIVKVHVLENSGYSPKEALNELATKTNSEPITAIGYRIVVYKESKNNKKLSLEVNKIR